MSGPKTVRAHNLELTGQTEKLSVDTFVYPDRTFRSMAVRERELFQKLVTLVQDPDIRQQIVRMAVQELTR